MGLRQATCAALTAACLLGGAATASATPAASSGAASSGANQASATAMQSAVNSADADFVMMMIPHHFQALVLSGLVEDGGSDAEVRALAERIEVEQHGEILMMQGWQGSNGLEVTNAEEAYQEMLQDPEMVEAMGMATPAELEDLSSAQGTAADVLFLQLMIKHHQGAINMLLDVITNGSDPQMQEWALDMLSVQTVQVEMMQQMQDRLS